MTVIFPSPFTRLFICISVTLAGCASMEAGWKTAEDAASGSTEAASDSQKKIAEVVAAVAQSDSQTSDVAKKALLEVTKAAGKLGAEEIDRKISNSHTEVNIVGIENGKPRFEISNVTGVNSYRDDKSQTFIQSSANNTNGRTTINVGLGQRYLNEDESLIVGVNAFLDYNVDYGHQRTSVGAELKSSAVDLAANKYFGLSDWKVGKDDIKEKALDGLDVELGAQLPFVPGAKIYLKKFKWDMVDATDIEGKTFSLGLSHIFGSGVAFEIGRKDYDGSKTDQDFIKLAFNVQLGGDGAESNAPMLSNKIYENLSVKGRMLEKVRRNNAIVVQTKFTSGVSGV